MTANTSTSDTELFEMIDKKLSETVDKEILEGLDHYLNIVSKKSKALASSLKRCFDNARKSMRYVLVYKLAQHEKNNDPEICRGAQMCALSSNSEDDNIEKHLEDYLKDYFEKNDFMHYREFVRLLRACTIDLGGEVSAQIKEMYNNFFLGKRLIAAYKLGKSNEND